MDGKKRMHRGTGSSAGLAVLGRGAQASRGGVILVMTMGREIVGRLDCATFSPIWGEEVFILQEKIGQLLIF